MEIIKELQTIGILKAFPKKSVIFNAGDLANGFYYITEGSIRLYKLDANGREIEMARLGEGDFLGEVILFATDTFPVHAESISEAMTLYFPKKNVLDAMTRHAPIAQFLLELMAKKCFTLNQRIEMLQLSDTRQRLIQFLLGRCAKDTNCTVVLPMKKVELAHFLSMTPETLSRTLKELQDENLIAVDGKIIKLKNCALMKKELI